MPYRGRPSQGCDECRKRRKKCDLKPGGCGRCLNARRQCPGYPKQNELRICDQSSEVIFKAIASRSKKGATLQASDGLVQSASPSYSETSSSASDSPAAMIPFMDPPPIDSDDRSLAFFFSNWVINDNMYHPFVHQLGNKHLIASIKAFSIASLSKYHADRRLLTSAQHQYATALNLTNAALRDPAQVLRDETLLSILILTNYETLTGGVTRTLDAWEQHINGASSLLSLRGVQGVQETAGRVLTLHVITSINVVCLLKDLPTPPFIHVLQAKIFEYLFEPENPAIRYQRLNLDCADFRHSVTSGVITSADDIIDGAAELDARLVAAFVDVPPGWEPEIITHNSEDRDSARTGLPDFELWYEDQATNYIWSSFRSSRIMVNEVVLQAVKDDTPSHIFARQHSYAILKQCQAEILASMPQYTCKAEQLPWSNFPRPVRYFVPEAVTSSLPIMRALSGYGILWPLFVAGTCSTSTPEIKRYVAEVYQYFGQHLKIEQALVLRRMMLHLSRVYGGDAIEVSSAQALD